MQVTVPALALCAAVYGAVAGALLPRPAYRLSVPPQTPWRQRCPSDHPLTGPARGWLGPARCRECVTSPPPGPGREPAEAADSPDSSGSWGSPGLFGTSGPFFAAVCAALCAALALSVGARPELAVWLAVAPFVLLLTAVDVRAQRLPDILTLPLTVATAALLGLAALSPGAGGSWTGALLGGVALASGFFVLFLINPRGMGFGDVKLAAPLGLALGWYGWDVLLAATLAAFLLTAGYGAVLMLAGRAGLKTSVPFGPFMAAGALGGVLLGGAG